LDHEQLRRAHWRSSTEVERPVTGWDAAHKMRLERLRLQQAIDSHVIAVEVLLDIYGDSPERLRELVKNELQELMVRSSAPDG
jgi:hypothetical protein